MLLHATCVAIKDHAVLLVGPSGCGKSDLALRLIDQGAKLVADDQTLLTYDNGKLIAAAAPAIAGLIEVRHIGLLKMPSITAPVALHIELAEKDAKLERLPDAAMITLEGVAIRNLCLPAFAASTPAKIRAALQYPNVENA